MRARLVALLNFDARKHEPTSSEDRIPAYYPRLSAARRHAVRERYVEEQSGRCWHCCGPLADPPPLSVLLFKVNWNAFPGREDGFLRHPVHLHHDHDTGMTIGAVHAYCNAVLWQYHGE